MPFREYEILPAFHAQQDFAQQREMMHVAALLERVILTVSSRPMRMQLEGIADR